jgi:periplasmic protein TonB
MLATLLESRRTVVWPVGNGALSLMVHTGVVAFAVALTASPVTRNASQSETAPVAVENVRYISTTAAPTGRGARRAATARPTRQLVAPTEVPDGIPAPPEVEELDYAAMIDAIDTYETDLVGLVSRADDFGPTDGSMTLARRLAGPLIIRAAGETYYAGEVERMAVPYADNPHPRYPPILLGGRVEGDVIVQFVVDSTGSADPKSLKIMRSTHELFTRAVKSVLPKLRFLPAEVAGNKVRVLVEQPFRFSVR